ncbi:MAG TPA: hypothetical protein VNX46_17315 [Candidatus Acidoferrum sp.]|jgi:hypothetical protein|nr:hypothetical protein [Candidatus Acidoferrum sp.]
MKSSILALFIFAFIMDCSEAQSPANQSQVAVPDPTPYAIVNQDANSQVWQREEYEAGTNNQIFTNIDSYTELETGLNYWRNGRYNASDERIEILPNGTAAATNGQHQVYFPCAWSDDQSNKVFLKMICKA